MAAKKKAPDDAIRSAADGVDKAGDSVKDAADSVRDAADSLDDDKPKPKAKAKKSRAKPKPKAKEPRKPRRTTKREVTFSKGQLPRGMTEFRDKKTILARHIDVPFGIKGGRKTFKGGYVIVHPGGKLGAMSMDDFNDRYEAVPVGESEVN